MACQVPLLDAVTTCSEFKASVTESLSSRNSSIKQNGHGLPGPLTPVAVVPLTLMIFAGTKSRKAAGTVGP